MQKKFMCSQTVPGARSKATKTKRIFLGYMIKFSPQIYKLGACNCNHRSSYPPSELRQIGGQWYDVHRHFMYPQKKSSFVKSGKRGGQVRTVSAGPFPWNFRSAVPHCSIQMNRRSAPSCWSKTSLRPSSFKIDMKLPPICLDTLHQSQHVRQKKTPRRRMVGIEYKRH